ncbi:hypothetical protein [uncultured Vagococcus sp.]|uniref:hypothetical protein n=1 Tax=uncultured Vagococcus sp. TaxID=189676 RepID=UPI0028D5E0A2|nr:hypothetical protein [uncultured Vagococcus sp.]
MDENESFEFKRTYLGQLFFSGFTSAYQAHELLFKDRSNDKSLDLPIAMAYLTEAHNYFLNAQTFFIDNFDTFDGRSEFSDTIDQFNIYNDEFLTNIRTDHSHQWSDIEYRSFVNKFSEAKGLLNIDSDNYWVDLALNGQAD